MTKKEIVKQISERLGLTQLKTTEIVQQTFDAIVETLLEVGRIELRNFGVFEVKQRKARKARNPKSKQEVFIPERKVVKFKPGKVMEDKITTPSMKGGIQPAPARKRENASEPPRVSGEGSLS